MRRSKVSILKSGARFAVAMWVFVLLMFSCGGDSSPVNSNSDGPGLSSGRGGVFTDIRDGQTYRYVTIGSQVWMAENLNFETSNGSWCYENSPDSCAKYGRLYDWATAMANSSSSSSSPSGVQGICPPGWHVPSDAEWTALIDFVGGSTAGTKLKSATGWYAGSDPVPGTDDFGFSAMPGGRRVSDGHSSGDGDRGYWWSATENDAAYVRIRYMSWNTGSVNNGWYYKTNGFSLRCVQSGSATPTTHTLTVEASPADCAENLTGGGPYDDGTSAQISVTAKAGCTFIGWDGAAGISDASSVNASVLMDAAKTVTANFRRDANGGDCGVGHGHFNGDVDYGCFTDTRNSRSYRTVKIGDLTWMAENLDFETSSGSWCYEDSPDSCAKYGRLYDWPTVMADSSSSSSSPSGVQGICPPGWHVPSDAEWTALTDFVGDASTAGTKLTSKTGWSSDGNGTDDFGFSAMPGGFRSADGSFFSAGDWGYWWSATEYDAADAKGRFTDGGVGGHVNTYWDDKTHGFSLRCVEDPTHTLSVTVSPEGSGTVSVDGTQSSGTTTHYSGASVTVTATASSGYTFTGWSGASTSTSQSVTVTMTQNRTLTANFRQTTGDGTLTYGGQTYRTVVIGTQTWMAENLNFVSGSWCYGSSPDSCAKYGHLYDWATVMDLPSSCNSNSCADQINSPHQGICPSGWHVPSDAEWTALTRAVGGAVQAGTKLKAWSGWNSGGNGTDDFGFSALPGGRRYTSGNFYYAGNDGYWWSATEINAADARYRYVKWDNNGVSTDFTSKDNGFSLRCVKDD